MPSRTLGLIGTSHKADEHRLPIHPRHLSRLDADVRDRLLVEEGYGRRFGLSAEELAAVARVAPRAEVLAEADVVLLPKPTHDDVAALHEGQVLWGWPHLVQDAALTQLAIDRRLTVIAWEAMNHWTSDGSFQVHVFHQNNELAGYCSVLHALSLQGRTGHYGPRLSAAVISFGATARGAVTALGALGVTDVTVLTQRDVSAVASPVPSVRMLQFERVDDGAADAVANTDDGPVPLAALLAEHDVVVNCVLQDTDAPLVFVSSADVERFRRGSLLVDVSCDEGMGFEFARPTSFADPTFAVGEHVTYYAVDHSPSYLWDAATWEISEALLPYLGTVLAEPPAWDQDETVRRAVEVRDGVVQNPKILSFQERAADYPHERTERPAGTGGGRG